MSTVPALSVGHVVRVLTTVRIATLLFSVPYIWTWTEGLSTPVRWSALGTHAFALLAANTWNDAADSARGIPPHLGLTREPVWTNGALARLLSWPFAAAAVVSSLGLLDITAVAPLAVGVLLVAVWFATRLPAGRKYFVAPELLAPLLVVITPAVALRVLAGASVAWSTVVAAAAFLSALVLATHIRDRERDLQARIPTIATRDLYSARGWLLLAATIGVLSALSPLDMPLSTGEILRGATALTFGAAAVIRRRRVSALTGAHGLFALTLLLF